MMWFIYDGSFEGFLSCVFEFYERKVEFGRIVRNTLYQPLLNEQVVNVQTDSAKAERVWSGLKRKISVEKRDQVYKAFLSEREDMEDNLLGFIRYVFSTSQSVEKDFSHKPTLYILQVGKHVHREKHRMEAFIRFQRTTDDIYYAAIEPDFNVLPLLVKHFKDRYADQHWIIYDRKRKYGIQYSLETGKVIEIELSLSEETDREFLPRSIVLEEEPHYQRLWQQYFLSVNISPRKNTKLHIRHVPLRYWRYLTEKIIK